MNKLKGTIPALALATAFSGNAMAADPSVSANIGMMSDYFFRGAFQADAVANGGVDLEIGGFYLGTWAADVDDGLEVDVYGGYGMEFDGGFSAGVGFTGYYYTGDTFDDTYEEINLSVGWNFLTLDYAIGEHDIPGGTEDYDFLSITAEYEGFYGVFGTFGDELDGDYFEVGYGTEIGGFDVSAALIFNDEDLSNTVDSNNSPDSDESFVFSISKSIDIM